METIKLLLCVDVETREYLWNLFLNYSLFVNQLLQAVVNASEFEKWRDKGTVSRPEIKKLIPVVKQNCSFELPAHCYESAILTVLYTFRSWFSVQQDLRFRIRGKKDWLQVMETDTELSRSTTFSDEAIQSRATDILAQLDQHLQASSEFSKSIMSQLFDAWKVTDDPLQQRAIAHLLRNNCQVSPEEEDPEALEHRLVGKGIQIARLEEQLKSRVPKTRDLLGDQYLQAIEDAISFAKPTEDFEIWEKNLAGYIAEMSRQRKTLPFPLMFDSSDDLHWSKNRITPKLQPSTPNPSANIQPQRKRKRKRRKKPEKRIFVWLKGKGFSHLKFSVYFDRRQQDVVEQFVKDYTDHTALKKEDKFSLGLFTLRSAQLLWKEDTQQLQKKGSAKNLNQAEQAPPWKTHRLYLHCTFEPRLLTAEGTQQVRQEKIEQTRKTLQNKQNELAELSSPNSSSVGKRDGTNGENENGVDVSAQKDEIKRAIKHLEASLHRLENNLPPQRPYRVCYQKDPAIQIGVSFGLHERVGVAVVDQRVPASSEFKGLPTPVDYYNFRKLLTRKDLGVLKERSDKLKQKYESRQEQQQDCAEVNAEGEQPRVKQTKRRKTIEPKQTVRQLQLSDYRLVNRLLRAREKNLIQRRKDQAQGKYTESREESRLAQYINRVIARRIIELCYQWKASSIIIPDLSYLPESIECEIQARAKKVFPDENVKLQKEYMKETRMKCHRWNHRHLAQCIRSCAAKHGIAVVTRRQPKRDTMREKAVGICEVTGNKRLATKTA